MSQLVKTKRQANFQDFKRFGAFETLYLTRSCVNWAFLTQKLIKTGPLVPKKPNLELNKLILFDTVRI
jgi:hypothetical protein